MKPQLFKSLKGYNKKDLFNDLFAGLMVAIIALPLSIALGIQSVPSEVSSNGIQFGIITAIVAGFFISALGGSKFLEIKLRKYFRNYTRNVHNGECGQMESCLEDVTEYVGRTCITAVTACAHHVFGQTLCAHSHHNCRASHRNSA